MSDNCAVCGKGFFILWRWRHICPRCGKEVCAACLSRNAYGAEVCPNCHVCTECGRITHMYELETVMLEPLPLLHLLCPSCHRGYESRLKTWVGGTKGEHFRGHTVVRELGLVRVEENDGCDDPAAVEELLRMKAAMAGGNGYIKFFWDKRFNQCEETYQAGEDKNGNAYYRTRIWQEPYFIGHAVAVEARPQRNGGGARWRR